MIENINFKSLIIFAVPSIFLMLFMSLYTMIDGAFVSNLVNQTALSAINTTLPVVYVVSAVGMMIGFGGNAIYSKLLGENKALEAKEKLTLFTVFGFITSLLLSAIVLLFMDNILTLLGADSDVWGYAESYLSTYLLFSPFMMLHAILLSALITVGNPNLALITTLIGGISNILLDYLFIGVLDFGITGAALATGIGNAAAGIICVIYFLVNKDKKTLSFTKPKFDFKALMSACTNGSSEMVTNLSSALITLLFNLITFRIAGNEGIASVTVILYAQFFINAIFIGYSMGVAPVISYYYGKQDSFALKNIFKISIKFIFITSIISFILAILLRTPIANFFLESGSIAYGLAVSGLLIFSLNFLVSGFNIFSSSMFTAFSNGRVSAVISFLRTFIFIAVSIIVFSYLFGINGVWLAVPIAEILSLFVSLYFINKYKNKYLYK